MAAPLILAVPVVAGSVVAAATWLYDAATKYNKSESDRNRSEGDLWKVKTSAGALIRTALIVGGSVLIVGEIFGKKSKSFFRK